MPFFYPFLALYLHFAMLKFFWKVTSSCLFTASYLLPAKTHGLASSSFDPPLVRPRFTPTLLWLVASTSVLAGEDVCGSLNFTDVKKGDSIRIILTDRNKPFPHPLFLPLWERQSMLFQHILGYSHGFLWWWAKTEVLSWAVVEWVGRWAGAINLYSGQNPRKKYTFKKKKLVVGSDITASLGLGLGFCLVAGLAV